MSKLQYSDPFDPRTATREEIRARAEELVGRTPMDFLRGAARERAVGDKGSYGFHVEQFFGIRPNSESAPDFIAAGIELKVVPIIKGAKGAPRTKERTVITMIDYVALAREEWGTATVRAKMKEILFVYYLHDFGRELLNRHVLGFHFWRPDPEIEGQLERDWSVVVRKVVEHRADQISERDGMVLGAATKASDSSKRREAPGLPDGAKPRAWALKQPYTTFLYSTVLGAPDAELISVLKGPDEGRAFEEEVLSRLAPFVGMRVREIAGRLGRNLDAGKAGQAWIVRYALGVVDDRSRLKEFEERGVRIKTVPVSPAGRPWEAMSFAGFKHMLIENEDWESSAFRQDIERLLVVPLERPTRASSRDDAIMRAPFFWTPTDEEGSGMRNEWEDFRHRIVSGQANALPTAADTTYIHVRPKAKDSADTEPAPGGLVVVKKSFWLNQDFLERILRRGESARSSAAGSPPSARRD